MTQDTKTVSNEEEIVKKAKKDIRLFLNQFDSSASDSVTFNYLYYSAAGGKISDFLEENHKISKITEIQRDYHNYIDTKKKYLKYKDEFEENKSKLLDIINN